jgi:DNA recombination protein Rad52
VDSDPRTDMITLLAQPLDPALVSLRPGHDGRMIAYLEGHQVINQANRIFGYGRWGAEIVGPVGYREIKTRDPATGETATAGMYWARVRVRVQGFEPRSDVGCAVTADTTADAHETAIKAAVTDALKRSCRHFGLAFGNGLYDKADPGRLAAERELADLRASLFVLASQLGLNEAEARLQTSRRCGRPFAEIGVGELAAIIRSLAEALAKRKRAA